MKIFKEACLQSVLTRSKQVVFYIKLRELVKGQREKKKEREKERKHSGCWRWRANKDAENSCFRYSF